MYRPLARDTSLWRAPLSSHVALVFVATFFQAFLSYSSAQLQDVTPPTLTAFSFTPTTIDTASGPASVAVSVSATDNLAGVSFAAVAFRSPSGVQVDGASSFSPAPSVSGTIHVSFLQFSEVGTWTVLSIGLQDAAGNTAITELAPLGFPTALVVTGQEDVTPPTPTAFSFTPTTIDTASGPASVAVSVSATDNLAGVSFAKVSFQSPSGVQHFEASTSFSPAPSVSGTIHVSFPQFSEVGTWTAVSIGLRDAAGNGRIYFITELTQLGFPTALVVMGQGDVTPPTLTAFSFTPTTIDTASGPASVAVSVSATDNLAGVSFAKVSFQSPSGVQHSEASTSFSPAPSVSGTIHVSFPQFSDVGPWTVVAVIISDAAGNDRYYSTTELAQLGFPTALVVEGKKM